jgi:hypothetical protein
MRCEREFLLSDSEANRDKPNERLRRPTGTLAAVRLAQFEEAAERRMPMTVSEIRILAADDQRKVRDNLKMILEAAGIHWQLIKLTRAAASKPSLLTLF